MLLRFQWDCWSERGVPAWHPAPKPLVEACRKAMEHCKAKNYPIEKLAMQFSVSNPPYSNDFYLVQLIRRM